MVHSSVNRLQTAGAFYLTLSVSHSTECARVEMNPQCVFRHSQAPGSKMKFTKNIGMLLLSIWLIVTGLMSLVPAIAFNGWER